jgi:predicted membrane protein
VGTLRSVSSLNNPQNSEMKFCENMASGDMLKIIIIIISLLISQYYSRRWKNIQLKINLNELFFGEKIIIHFFNVETDPKV